MLDAVRYLHGLEVELEAPAGVVVLDDRLELRGVLVGGGVRVAS